MQNNYMKWEIWQKLKLIKFVHAVKLENITLYEFSDFLYVKFVCNFIFVFNTQN